jgi:hypothetical protein
MYEIKNILGFVATILVFVGYIPYVRDIIKGKTKPHVYSWFIWTFLTSIVFALQLRDGAGSASLVTLAAAICCLSVLLLGIYFKNKIKITMTDNIFLFLSVCVLGLWLIAKQPVISAILATLIDVLAFAPTVRKSWNQPYSETLSFYYLNSFRFGLAVLALQKYTIVSAIYPIIWLLANGLFAVLIVVRRKQLPQS